MTGRQRSVLVVVKRLRAAKMASLPLPILVALRTTARTARARTQTSHCGPGVVYVEGGPRLEAVRLEM